MAYLGTNGDSDATEQQLLRLGWLLLQFEEDYDSCDGGSLTMTDCQRLVVGTATMCHLISNYTKWASLQYIAVHTKTS
ncbi:uncharacterized protein N7477_010029 [Penicillium maclennaniae]|uniref:uncharacterized protein n=1 Tax=Penicillium maclennaniae TaxID=1343394 RepID=UPI00254074EF|nr:uncharacterized protein N7477_010029 [Penicillium maclennaniae]KAJ5662413.1 hypothetical protein N7477_010029 [Penicillium maclennaniae]